MRCSPATHRSRKPSSRTSGWRSFKRSPRWSSSFRESARSKRSISSSASFRLSRRSGSASLWAAPPTSSSTRGLRRWSGRCCVIAPSRRRGSRACSTVRTPRASPPPLSIRRRGESSHTERAKEPLTIGEKDSLLPPPSTSQRTDTHIRALHLQHSLNDRTELVLQLLRHRHKVVHPSHPLDPTLLVRRKLLRIRLELLVSFCSLHPLLLFLAHTKHVRPIQSHARLDKRGNQRPCQAHRQAHVPPRLEPVFRRVRNVRVARV
mmetsp:Transcript_14619/g.47973  ORF Transcript_14619/g.47973 Transcript_14619/m.47973 type:complete len:263 (+) Transcript_14619:2483-3271(+)